MFSRFTKSFMAGLRPGSQTENWLPSDDFNSTDLFLWLDSETNMVLNGTTEWSPNNSHSEELIAWYDASDTATITGNPTVSQLNDKSFEGGFHLSVQGDPQTSVDTLNSLNTITLTGNDDRLEVLNYHL